MAIYDDGAEGCVRRWNQGVGNPPLDERAGFMHELGPDGELPAQPASTITTGGYSRAEFERDQCGETGDRLAAESAARATAASCELGNPPPLPAPHVEVLRWNDPTTCATFAVDDQGETWYWRAGWTSYQKTLASNRLAAEVVALRARVEELTALVEKAWRDGYVRGDGRCAYGKPNPDMENGWRDSAARRVLLAGKATK